jgi:hypothetical protein
MVDPFLVWRSFELNNIKKVENQGVKGGGEAKEEKENKGKPAQSNHKLVKIPVYDI